MFTLLKKEIRSFLSSLIGYIAITVFLLVISLFLWVLQTDSNILESGYANIDPLFIIAPWVFLFLIPAITMRSFADEKKAGTIELLLTRPLTDLQIILSKYFAGFLLVLFSLIPTLIYYYSVHMLGSPAGNIDTGGMWGSYIGLMFLGAAFVAIGIFASAITDNQVVSFILALFLCYFTYTGFDFMASFDLFGKIDNIILALGINHHYISMSRGVIDTRDVIYFVSLIAFFIVATRTVLESRKWEPHPASPKGRSKWLRIFTSPWGRSGGASAVSLVLAIIILVLLNVVGSFVFHRLDLTSEKRYTLSDATKKLLGELNDVVYVKVYLEGDFPSGFKRLRDETREMLDEFRVYSNENIEYEFINPNENPDKKQREEVYRQLFKKGLQPTNLEVKEEGGISQQIIFPGAIVSHKGREMAWQLLKTNMGQSPEAQLNNSVQALEYEFASCIRNLSTAIRPQIGIIEGHGELDTLELQDLRDALSEFYYVRQVKINEQLKALDGLKAIIVAKPDTAFSEKDKFIIDQYVMKGGKVLWALDPLNTSMDSLRKLSRTVAIPQELKLDDQLFKYGARLNPNIIMDLQSSAIPVNKAFVGQPPRFELMPWVFSPLLLPKSNHPIVKNLDVIKVEYASTIDTIDVRGIQKTILLQTSKYSKTLNAPVRVDLRMVNMTPDENQFKDSYKPVAVLLEGEFESVYKNRIPPQIASDSAIDFKDKGVATKMIVISDGDVIRNEVQYSARKAFPLGYDIYTKQTYGNKNFILNCMNYLCDDSGLITVRARELTLRLLDKKKMKNERLKWQIINTGLPLLAILVFGIIYSVVRRRKYAK